MGLIGFLRAEGKGCRGLYAALAGGSLRTFAALLGYLIAQRLRYLRWKTYLWKRDLKTFRTLPWSCLKGLGGMGIFDMENVDYLMFI